MANDFYTHSSFPSAGSAGSSASMRSELDSISQGFDKLPGLSGNGYKIVYVNAGGSALAVFGGAGLLKLSSSGIPSIASAGTDYYVPGAALGTPASGTLSGCSGLPAAGVTGTALVSAAIGTTVQAYGANLTTWAGVAPGTGVATALGVNVGTAGSPVVNGGALGTPSSGVATNLTGTAASLTAGNVTTNANLTGDITSVGNSTTLTNAPVIAKVLTGYVSGAGVVAATDTILQAIQKLNGNDATNANLTGDVTSVGNATTVAKLNGTTLSGLATGVLKNTTGTGVPSIAAAGTDYARPDTLSNWTKAQIGTPVALSVSANAVAVDLSLGNNFTLTLQATTTQTLSNPTNAAAGQSGSIYITQNGTPSLLQYGANWIEASAGTSNPPVSTTAGAQNILSYTVFDSTHIYFTLLKHGVA